MGIEKKVLKKFVKLPPEESIVEVIDYWLRKHDGQPTWREIAEALKQLGFRQLSLDFESIYDTGIIIIIRSLLGEQAYIILNL